MGHDAEIGIVGAGPAGARAAELLADAGADVLLWDPRTPWEKPCGGGLTAAALRDVPELVGVLPLARRTDHVLLDGGDGRSLDLPLAEPIHILARRDLAAWQLERARRAGARFAPRTVRGVKREADGWTVTLDDGASRRVRLLVGADGAASTVRRATSPELAFERAPTRLAWPELAPDSGALAVRFSRERAAYLWDFPRPDHRSLGIMGIEGAGWSRASMDDAVDAYAAQLGRPADAGAPRGGAIIATALRPRRPGYADIGAADFALLGDAAALADPATGEGIRNALRSAGFLAAAFRRDGSFAGYAAAVEAALEPEFHLARRLRLLLYQRSIVPHLIGLARRSATLRAFLAACFDAANEHDFAMRRQWRRARRRLAA
jgi:flavin-dependent dehydrogenase